MKILAIDTSCDETAAAVTENENILSNIIWSQASAHAKFGGVMPSLAQRMHRERINFVINKALKSSKTNIRNVDAIAVTIGPGLSIALGVGIEKAKELAVKFKKPLLPVNHVESHLLSPFANIDLISKIKFPLLGLVVSGGNTQLILIKSVGDYKILAETQDDALGEALDKGARLLGFGYPGGAILEKFAKKGNPKIFSLPIPLVGDKIKNRFSYSGLKTAFMRLVTSLNNVSKEDINNLASSYQDVAFRHILNVVSYQIDNLEHSVSGFLLGGGVANNTLLKSKLRKLLKTYGITLYIPYSKKILGDNAAMIGVCAYLKYKGEDLKIFLDYNSIDRKPNFKINI